MSTDTEPRNASSRRAATGSGEADRAATRRWLSPAQTVAVLLGALLLGAIMNASSLAATAERQPFGWQRSVAVAVVGPVETLSEVTGLGGAHAWLVDGIGGWFRPTVREPAAPGGRIDERAAGGDHAEAATTDDDADANDGGGTDGAEEAEATTPRRAPSEEDPLTVWVAGDSLVEPLAAPLSSALEGRLPAEVTAEPQYSTGLARPDYFDWPAHAEATVAAEDPDVVVVMLGGNDDQDMRGDEVILRRDDGWVEEYRRRVDDLLDALTGEGAEVLWLGLPVMQDPDFDAAMAELDAAYAEAAEARADTTHLPIRELLADDGSYATYLEGPDGGVDRMRRDDGIHLTPDGGRLVVDTLLAEAVLERWAPDG